MQPQLPPWGQVCEADEPLMEKQRQLAMAVEQAGESIVVTDAEGFIVYVNPAFESTTGYRRAEVLGQNPRILKSGAHNRAFYEDMWQELTRGQTWRGRLINKRKDGTLYHEEASISPVADETGRIVSYVAVKRDITRETDLEKQFHEAQRMEAVGQLAGGVAHDFNNLLSVILGCVELLEEKASLDEPSAKYLGMVQQAASRATQLTTQLLAFSRRQVLVQKVLDLNAVVTETEAMLGRLVRENIHIVTRLEKQLGRIKADPGQLQQCILNLAVNARDAMPEGGRLTIETQNIFLTEEYKYRHDMVPPGHYVLLSVTDNGIGMSPEVQSRIFEPFYTTKPKGHGTGLGLASIYGIVKQSSGYIWVYSEVGRGTTFKVYLPRTDQPLHPMELAPLRHSRLPAKLIGNVLLVEDDCAVRQVTRMFLEDAGLTVLEAASSEDAIQIAASEGAALRVLITDLMLPGKDGIRLAGELLVRSPGLKVILMSGYTEHGLPDPTSLQEATFLSKPFSRKELIDRVASLLGHWGIIKPIRGS